MDLEPWLWAHADDWIDGVPGKATIARLTDHGPAAVPEDVWTYLAPALAVAGATSLRAAAAARSGAAVVAEERQRDAAVRIGAALARLGLPHAFFKGCDLRYRVYPGAAQRDAQDLDLLCSPGRIRDTVDTLERTGLTAERSVDALVDGAAHEATIRSEDVVVDLHVAPMQQDRSRFSADDVLGRRVRIDVAGGALHVPEPVDALALCLIHIGVHEGGAEHVSFKHGLDVALAFRAWPDLDVDVLAARVRGWRCRRLAGAGLWTWRPALGALVPERAYRRIDPGPIVRAVASGARRRDRRPRTRASGAGRLAQLGRKFLYAEGLREKGWLIGELWRRRGLATRSPHRQEK